MLELKGVSKGVFNLDSITEVDFREQIRKEIVQKISASLDMIYHLAGSNKIDRMQTATARPLNDEEEEKDVKDFEDCKLSDEDEEDQKA